MTGADSSGPGSRRYARQLCRAYARVLAERFVDDGALAGVLPYLARCVRHTWDLSRGNFLRSTIHRVLIMHAQLARVPAGTAQRVEARDQLVDAVRDLQAIVR